MAGKNIELDAAKKAVEAKKDSLTAANNELTKAANDTTLTKTALNTANNTLKSAQASYNSVKRNYDSAQEAYETDSLSLQTLENELQTLQTTGTTVKIPVGLDEQSSILDFLVEVLSESETTEPELYYTYASKRLAFSLLPNIKDKSDKDLGFTKDKKVTPETWSTVFSADELANMPLSYIAFYGEVKYKEYNASADGENKIVEKQYYKIILKSSGGNATDPTDLADKCFAAIDGYTGNTTESVTKIDEDAVAAKQKEVNDQKKVFDRSKKSYENEKLNLADAQGVLADAQATANSAQTAYNNAKAAVEKAEGKVTTATTNLTNAQGEVTRIENEITAINASVNAVNDYKTLSITDNITIPALTAEEITAGKTLLTLGDWGSDYTINGNGNVITYPANAEGSLVGVNRGVINNLGVVNGTLATANAGSMRIAFETTDGTNYDLYDASGTHTEAPMSGELAYNRARPYFGVTINANGTFGILDKKTAANTVYKAEWTDARTKNTTTFYTNATTTDLSYNPAKGKDNTFAYVLDNDLNVTAAFTAKNVVVKGICKNAEFTDDVTEGDNGYIYIPTAFKAEKLSYNRSFSASALATVCLPFEVSEATFKAAGVTNTMQFYELEAATNTYWFKYQEGSMRANEPYILKFGENFAGGTIFAALENINVAATGSIDRFAVAPERPGSGADFLGVFVSTNATQLAQGGYTLYGFGGGKFRPMTISESNKCLPFRTYVRARNTGNAPAEVFNIGELDEDGNIVTDGGETAISTTEAETFSVRGINGALVITTDKAQRVSIYTIGGSLVKATNVEAGSVTVPVAAGMYIVNGKKVFVK